MLNEATSDYEQLKSKYEIETKELREQLAAAKAERETVPADRPSGTVQDFVKASWAAPAVATESPVATAEAKTPAEAAATDSMKAEMPKVPKADVKLQQESRAARYV